MVAFTLRACPVETSGTAGSRRSDTKLPSDGQGHHRRPHHHSQGHHRRPTSNLPLSEAPDCPLSEAPDCSPKRQTSFLSEAPDYPLSEALDLLPL